ncbi:MAG TPA: response regulator [Verrucomicrobiae bacterium]|nr:response regulator [Verrucomicrobiae bacterium]
MTAFKLLIVEDNNEDLNTCKASVVRYRDEHQREFNLYECKTVDDATRLLDNSFDGAIVDLKLANEGNEGNQVLKRIADLNVRIPVAVLTGTPAAADAKLPHIGIFKKGETSYEDILDQLWGIHNSGLTRIMGGRGVLEQALSDVYNKNLLPQKEVWIKYGALCPGRTERALLRFTLNHLLQLLDEDSDQAFPEEMYIAPPFKTRLMTGSVVRRKLDGAQFVVLNPACDLVIRKNDQCKTDRFLLVEVEDQTSVTGAVLRDVKKDKRERKLREVFHNNYTDYYHWLPETAVFPGGFMNFRKVTALDKSALDNYAESEVQICGTFIKDIVARFSSYYARQGQPDVDCERIIKTFLAEA